VSANPLRKDEGRRGQADRPRPSADVNVLYPYPTTPLPYLSIEEREERAAMAQALRQASRRQALTGLAHSAAFCLAVALRIEGVPDHVSELYFSIAKGPCDGHH
jgi:hypothetical protein